MFLEVFLNNKPNHQQWFCIQLDVFLSFKLKVIYLVVICKISLLNTHKPIVYLIVLHKKNLSFLKGLVVAGTGFISPRCSEMGQK
jgi:hypothetical protein